jgi:hypothetical protein
MPVFPFCKLLSAHFHFITAWSGTKALILRTVMLAAAQRAACRVLYSEVLQNGQTAGTVTILDPFAIG